MAAVARDCLALTRDDVRALSFEPYRPKLTLISNGDVISVVYLPALPKRTQADALTDIEHAVGRPANKCIERTPRALS